MLTNNYYYHTLLKKYVIYFGSLFNDIVIERRDNDESLIQSITVPIAYGPKQKFIARMEEDLKAERSIAITLPRISFEITAINYDAGRKLNNQQKIVIQNPINSNEYNYVHTLIPYNITFSLSVYSKNIEDNLQVVEQILPYFAPEWTSSIILIPDLDLAMDIPVVLQNVVMSDRYEGSMETPRYIVNTMQFVMKGWLCGPIRNIGIIKRTTVNISKLGGTFVDLYVTSNTNPAFLQGDRIYQTNGKRITARGVVEYSTESYVQVGDVSGNFNSTNTIISSTSLRRADVTNVIVNTAIDSTITITPGLFANGSPTSNSELSIPIEYIKSTDDYGISIDISEYND